MEVGGSNSLFSVLSMSVMGFQKTNVDFYVSSILFYFGFFEFF